MTTLYFIRHAESRGNEAHRLVGHLDNDVSELGMLELDRLAERFRYISLYSIYASPLTRTQKTAAAVNRYHELEIHTDRRLIELYIGLWEGQSWDELPILYPELYYKVWRGSMCDFSAPDGEPMAECYKRVGEAVDEIAAQNDGKSVAVVSHGCALRNFYAHAAYGDIKMLPQSPMLKNTSITKASFSGGSYEFEFVNDYSHVADLI